MLVAQMFIKQNELQKFPIVSYNQHEAQKNNVVTSSVSHNLALGRCIFTDGDSEACWKTLLLILETICYNEL
jgi:hypothetical protein